MFQCDSTRNVRLVAVPVVDVELRSGIRHLTAVIFDLLDGGLFHQEKNKNLSSESSEHLWD